MAVIEQDGLLQYIDESGNLYIIYPVTTLSNVSGTGKLVQFVNGATLKTIDGTNIALITAEDIADFVTSGQLEELANTANATNRVKYEDGVLKTLSGAEIVTGNAKFAIGEYTGTGTYGADNPSSLAFDFEPKMVFFTSQSGDTAKQSLATRMILKDLSTAYQKIYFAYGEGTKDMYAKLSPDRKTLYWYSTAAYKNQLNCAGKYWWVAIG